MASNREKLKIGGAHNESEALCRGRLPTAVVDLSGCLEGESFGGEARAYSTPLGTYLSVRVAGLSEDVYTLTVGGRVLSQLYCKNGEAWCGTMTEKFSAWNILKEEICIKKAN